MRVAPRPDSVEKNLETEALMRGVVSQFERFARFSRSVAPEQYAAAMQADEPGKLADLVSQHLPLKLEERQQLLELAPKDRLELLSQVLTREVNILELERKIQNRVRKQMEKSQREYFLKEEMKAIQQELGESDERQSEVAEYKKKIEAANLPEHVKEKALEELSRLEKMPPMVAEAVVVRTYLDWLLAVPWAVRTEDRLDITEARRILDEDHYGLDKAKDRVVEYLAVRKLAPTSKGPILCFIGPPGTGKTSLGRSIARALGGSLCGSAWAACAMKRRSAATAAPMWGRCPAGSSRDSRPPAARTPYSCWTRSTSWAWTGGAIRPPRCWRRSTPSRTTASAITTWRFRSTSLRSCSSAPGTSWTPFRPPCATGSRSSGSRATLKRRN